MTAIASPLDGTLMPLSEVPDPVFAQGLVGPGVALEPTGEGDVTVVAPVAGRIVKLHPHAFVIQAEGSGYSYTLALTPSSSMGRGSPFMLRRVTRSSWETHSSPGIRPGSLRVAAVRSARSSSSTLPAEGSVTPLLPGSGLPAAINCSSG